MLKRFNRKMNSHFETRVYLGIIAILAIGIAVLHQSVYTMLFAVLIIAAAFYFARKNSESQELLFTGYMDNIVRNIERANHFAVSNLDIGMAVFSKEGKLQWKNETFTKWVGRNGLEGMTPEEILPLPENMTFDSLCIKDGELVVQLNDRRYQMRYAKVATQNRPDNGAEENSASGLIVYLKDVTEHMLLKEKYANERVCLAYIRMDSYEDVMRGLTETEIASLSGDINTLLTKWAAEHAGFICRMNKEMCLAGFTRSAVEYMESTEFDILKKIRQVRVGNKIAPTISIGIDCDGETLEDMMHNANDILFQALARGGDQALIVKDGATKAYGATNFVNAKSTRVRVRLVASAIKEAMEKADRIFVMGHYDEDFDAIGSVIGVAKLGKSLNKETIIVTSDSEKNNPSMQKVKGMLDEFWDRSKLCAEETGTQEEFVHYPELMLNEDEAVELVTPKSLLVLVDHHRASLSASKKLLENIKDRVIIDHHRRAEDILANESTLVYLEPSSSSTCELVTELTRYFNQSLEFSAAEATALYAGIVLDTKSFVVQTSERTFEAAALLRRNGADPNIVKNLFKDDFAAIRQRSKLIAGARMPLPGFAMCVNRNVEKGETASVIAAQTSDRMISVSGIIASATINEYTDGSVGVSARSSGAINMQVVMEALGGGGHQTVAGAQLNNKRAKDIEPIIIEMVKKQLDKISATEGDVEI